MELDSSQPTPTPGSRAEFRCEVSSGLGEVSYLWTFNTSDITELDQFNNRTNIESFGSRLVITNLDLEDSGTIGCQASNNQSVSRHQAGWRPLIGPDQSRYSPLIGATLLFYGFWCVVMA